MSMTWIGVYNTKVQLTSQLNCVRRVDLRLMEESYRLTTRVRKTAKILKTEGRDISSTFIFNTVPRLCLGAGESPIIHSLTLFVYFSELTQEQARGIRTSKFEIWLYHEGPTLQSRITQKWLDIA